MCSLDINQVLAFASHSTNANTIILRMLTSVTFSPLKSVPRYCGPTYGGTLALCNKNARNS